MKRILFILLIVSLLILNGCETLETKVESVTDTLDISELEGNPETYLDNEVKVKGTLVELFGFELTNGAEIKYRLEDSQGFFIHLEVPQNGRAYYDQSKYMITGILKKGYVSYASGEQERYYIQTTEIVLLSKEDVEYPPYPIL